MRKYRKRYFIKDKKPMKTTIFSILIVAVLVLSSLVIGIHIQDNQEKMDVKKMVETEKPSNGLPLGTGPSTPSTRLAAPVADTEFQNNGGNSAPLSSDPTMYGYVAYSGAMTTGPCYFATETPGDITKLSDETVPGFASGGTWTNDGRWLVCDYNNGALYEIDPVTGIVTEIGGGGTGLFGLNGLACDPTTGNLYGASSDGVMGGLWLISQEDGSQKYIGDFVNTKWIIGIAFDADGVLYGWDISPDYLYKINKETGEATPVGSLGINLNYAQDGDFDKENDILYLTAFTLSPSYGAFLYTCDKDTGVCTLVGPLEDGSTETDASMFMYTSVPPEHDIGVKSIDLPVDGCAHPDMDMQVTVKNYGTNTEITDVQMEIFKFEAGLTLLTEDFSTWPPTDWSYYSYEQSFTNYAMGTLPAEAYYGYFSGHYYSYGWIMTPPINGNGYDKINVKFRLYGDFAGYPGTYFYLQYRKNADSPWETLSSWDNPVAGDLGPAYYEIAYYGIGCYGKDIGDAFQVRWYFGSYYYYLQYNSGIYLDDVEIQAYTSCGEYTSLVEDVEVPYDGEVIVDEFDKWTPGEGDCPVDGCSDVTYYVTASTLLDDDNPWNDCKREILPLCCYYDVRVKEIIEPPRCLSLGTFPVQAIVENVGFIAAMDLTCYAQIYEFITDPEHGTLIYDDYVANVDLDVGETIIVTFCDIYFGYKGKYKVTICIPCVDDVNPDDNCLTKELFFDENPPITTHTLDPASPDGLNGWYISCVTVTLDATDTLSGVDATYYRLDGGAWTLYDEPFVVCDCGENIVEYYSMDACGNMEPVNSVSFKVDTTPPEITQIGEPIDLWPPNHKYHTIAITDFVTLVTDICDPDVDIDDIIITSVSSDEPEDVTGEGDGHTLVDIVIVDSQTVELRAERQGDGNGRVYTINFEVTDASGNTATGFCKVWVRHDQSGDPPIDDGPDAGYTVYYP